MSTSRRADAQRISQHLTGGPGITRRPVPQRRTSDRECRCHLRRCQWLGISTRLTNINRHSIHPLCNHTCETSQRRWRRVSKPEPPARRAYPRNSVAVNLQRRYRQTPGGAARSAWSDSDMHKCRTTNSERAGIFNPNPASPDDGEGNRAVNHWHCEGWKLFTHA